MTQEERVKAFEAFKKAHKEAVEKVAAMKKEAEKKQKQ